MSRLVAYYEDEPVRTKGSVEVEQLPLADGGAILTSDGEVRANVVYVVVPNPVGSPLHVPFAAFDEWFLRDRYGEALRIVNTLGASSIECKTSRDTRKGTGITGTVKGFGAGIRRNRRQTSLFDYSHAGTGSQPRDPRPLRWPDEPGFGAAVSSVLDNKATTVTINISSTTRHSVKGSLGKKLAAFGFELGVSGESSDAVSLHMVAKFPERSRWR
ncbi:hypothetical protein [Nocardioides sp.]|uniref:hypothetical protein n=1 Tax=Nocardioides sp. TaxID=35761 RepID=UPI0035B0E3EB